MLPPSFKDEVVGLTGPQTKRRRWVQFNKQLEDIFSLILESLDPASIVTLLFILQEKYFPAHHQACNLKKHSKQTTKKPNYY